MIGSNTEMTVHQVQKETDDYKYDMESRPPGLTRNDLDTMSAENINDKIIEVHS